jgi:hypothetical protein
VPLIFSNPRLVPEGRSCPNPAPLIDIVPTLASILGVERPPALRGTDLSPLVRDPPRAGTRRSTRCTTWKETSRAGEPRPPRPPAPPRSRHRRRPGAAHPRARRPRRPTRTTVPERGTAFLTAAAAARRPEYMRRPGGHSVRARPWPVIDGARRPWDSPASSPSSGGTCWSLRRTIRSGPCSGTSSS